MKNKFILPGQLSLSILNQSLPAGINFRVDTYFDPYGDGKSKRKLFKREFFYSFRCYQEILNRFDTKKYYGSEVIFAIKPYQKAKNF